MFAYIQASDIQYHMISWLTKRNKIVVGSVSFAVLIVIVTLILRGTDSSQNKRMKILSDNVDLQARDVVYSDIADSGMKWEIIADSANYTKNKSIAVFNNLKVKVITKDGRTFSMRGKKGTVNTKTKDMDINGDVHILSDQGDQLTTDGLKYAGAEQRIYTDLPVVMENSGMRVVGKGMSLSLKNRKLSLLSNIKARINRHGH
jgi:LPS export ABC transporter protein LptC